MNVDAPRWRWAVVAPVLTLGLAGCASGPSAPADPAPKTVDAGLGDDAPVEDSDGSALAAQARRDVEAFEAMRRDAAANDAESRTPVETGPPKIVWNTPDRPRTNRRGDDAPTGKTPTTAITPPLGTIAPPPIEVQSLPTESGTNEERAVPGPVNLDLVQLRQRLYRASIDSDRPIRELLTIAAMSMIDPELELPSGIERSLTDEEVKLLEDVHEFFAELGEQLGHGERAKQVVADAVAELQRAVDERPELRLPAIELCWRIGGFGRFDAFDRNVFLAHGEQQVILYLEIEGFTSELNKQNEWITELSQQLEIISDRDGLPVWNEPWQKAYDKVNRKRRDFFTTQVITLPKALGVGRYHLKIRVRDERSGAEAEHSVEFEMVADPRMAATVGSE
jgi:hypothetical protein